MPADEPWDRVAVVHHAIHAAIVDAAGSRRLSAAYAALQGELLFFVTRIRPQYTVQTMIDAHRLLADAVTSGDAGRRRGGAGRRPRQGPGRVWARRSRSR